VRGGYPQKINPYTRNLSRTGWTKSYPNQLKTLLNPCGLERVCGLGGFLPSPKYLHNCQICHIKREAKFAAHRLAKFRVNQIMKKVWIEKFLVVFIMFVRSWICQNKAQQA
jgi:hypothetical protein